MRNRSLRPLILGVLLATLAATGSGAPNNSTGRGRLLPPAHRPPLEPVAGGRFVVPRVHGFGHGERAGEPMLPLKRLLVAIPEGCVPELRVVSISSEPLGRLTIAPVPRL